MANTTDTLRAVDLPRLVRHWMMSLPESPQWDWMRREMAEAIEVTQEYFIIRDFSGGQSDEIVSGKDAAELRAMTLMLWYSALNGHSTSKTP